MIVDAYTLERKNMVLNQLKKRNIDDLKVLKAFSQVPRHLFVPLSQIDYAYYDRPLDIGCEQTISQPYMVALMTQELDLEPGMKVLEVGTGSGYQSAILHFLGARVYTIERFEKLADSAKEVFKKIGYDITVKVGDGTLGSPKEAPFERIIVTAAAAKIPQTLLSQLAVGGILVMPVGSRLSQELIIAKKISSEKIDQRRSCACIFVPLVGKGL
ncbi:MAG: protein-L-isoaspartate(D-aspartate) O-methyltransferase [Candidatus Omnitrophica bacterium]|nr:protein-L-isoaspartate(D-aspartate) O-methyltransferase [Candidatus Omnitrophota bacterium]